jgi:hypothetical protein
MLLVFILSQTNQLISNLIALNRDELPVSESQLFIILVVVVALLCVKEGHMWFCDIHVSTSRCN